MYRSMVQPVRVSRVCGMASSASGGTTRTAHGPCFSDRTGTKAAALGCNSGQGCAIACSVDVLERGEDSREPFVDVMLGKVHVRSGYAVGLFLGGHLDGVFEGICHALRIRIRVDEQGDIAAFLPIRLSQCPETPQSLSASLLLGTASRPSGLLGIDTRGEI